MIEHVKRIAVRQVKEWGSKTYKERLREKELFSLEKRR